MFESEVSQFEDILTTLLGFGIVALLVFYFLSILDRILDKKLKFSLFRTSSNQYNQPLQEVFYKFNHKSTKEWCKWILSQDEEMQDIALAKLLDHINLHPAHYGVTTSEAVYAISLFNFPGVIEVLRNFIETLRDHWSSESPRVIKSSYVQALKGIIRINKSEALEIISDEISKDNYGIEEIGKTIIDILSGFVDKEGVSELFVKIIINKNEILKNRKYAIKSISKNHKFLESLILRELLEYFIDSELEFNEDDSKIFEIVFSDYFVDINDQSFDLFIKSWASKNLSKILVDPALNILSNPQLKFNSEQLYAIYKLDLEKEVKEKIEMALARRFSLEPLEIELIKAVPALEKFPFHKSPMSRENFSEIIELPEDLLDKLEYIKNALTPRIVTNEKGEKVQGGSIFIAGQAEKEKLYIARSIAASRRWSIVHGYFDEVFKSGLSFRNFQELVLESKPCLVFMEDMMSALNNPDESAIKNLIHLSSDPMVFIIGTVKQSLKLEEGEGSNPMLKTIPRDLFHLIEEIGIMTDEEKERRVVSLMSKLSSNREHISISAEEILKKTQGICSLDFDKYIHEYFKLALLVFGVNPVQ